MQQRPIKCREKYPLYTEGGREACGEEKETLFFPVSARQPHPHLRFHNPTFSRPQLAGRPALSCLTIGSCVCPMLSSSTSANQRKTIIIPWEPLATSTDLYRHCTHAPQTITAVHGEGSAPVHST